MPQTVRSYRDQLYSAWRTAQGRLRTGSRLGWPEQTLAELKAKADEAKADLEAYERHLLAGGKLYR